MPAGNPASWTSSAKASSGAGPSSEAFSTTVQPAASAGPSLTADRKSCEFHGTTAATTPIGSRPDRHLHIGLVDRNERAFVLVGQPAIIAVVVADIGDLGAGLADDLAGVAGLELRQPAGIGGDQIAELHQRACRAPSPSSMPKGRSAAPDARLRRRGRHRPRWRPASSPRARPSTDRCCRRSRRARRTGRLCSS